MALIPRSWSALALGHGRSQIVAARRQQFHAGHPLAAGQARPSCDFSASGAGGFGSTRAGCAGRRPTTATRWPRPSSRYGGRKCCPWRSRPGRTEAAGSTSRDRKPARLARPPMGHQRRTVPPRGYDLTSTVAKAKARPPAGHQRHQHPRRPPGQLAAFAAVAAERSRATPRSSRSCISAAAIGT